MIGIDVVDVERLRTMLARSPGLEERLFTSEERSYCHGRRDPVVHLAGTLAAKESVIKALGLGSLASWARRIEITRNGTGAPRAVVSERKAALEVSISHDGGWAVGMALTRQS
jgi:holo-[acyl-carrier protein] synthase